MNHPQYFWPKSASKLGKPTLLVVLITILLILPGCLNAPVQEGSVVDTLTAQGVKATVDAQLTAESARSTSVAQQAVIDAQATVLAQNSTQLALLSQAPTVDLPATQAAIELQSAAMAQQQSTQAALLAEQQASAATAQAATQAASQLPSPTVVEVTPDFEAQMKSADILLYEDIVFHPETIRYVKKTLDRMGLPYTDVGSAVGRFKSQLLSAGPKGEGWDLVIIAAEAKSLVSGEFFEYVNKALDKGTSVILEVWYFDQTMGANGAALLARCGVEFQKDWAFMPPERMVMFTLDETHPILIEPNDQLTFTKVTDFWAYDWDVGDLMRKSISGGDAKMLVGTMGTEKTNHATVMVCVDDQLILQTFSSHNLTFDVMTRLWENYIYHGLKTRFANGS
jgi:hypothetical protein